MAGIRLERNKKTWLVYFRWEGRKREFSTGLTDRDRALAKAQEIEEFRQLALKKRHLVPPNVTDVARWIATEGQDGFRQPDRSGPQIATIDDLVTRYLETRRLRLTSKTKPLSHASYQSDVYRLDNFKAFCKRKRKTQLNAAISAETLEDYRNGLLAGTEGPVSVRHKLRTVKALLDWAYNVELIDASPRILRKYSDIELPKPAPKFFTLDEVKRAYTKATPEVKLWILLGLNCGYTQTDIATLTPEMIDWEQGIIRRNRQKTGVESEHKLWPKTLELLRQQASDGPLLLTTRAGLPLVRTELKENGRATKTDMVVHMFSQLKKEADLPLPFKHFRKTAADAIAKQFQDQPWLVEQFLAHADPRTRKYYAEQHYDALHKATDWLWTHFGMESASGEHPTGLDVGNLPEA